MVSSTNLQNKLNRGITMDFIAELNKRINYYWTGTYHPMAALSRNFYSVHQQVLNQVDIESIRVLPRLAMYEKRF